MAYRYIICPIENGTPVWQEHTDSDAPVVSEWQDLELADVLEVTLTDLSVITPDRLNISAIVAEYRTDTTIPQKFAGFSYANGAGTECFAFVRGYNLSPIKSDNRIVPVLDADLRSKKKDPTVPEENTLSGVPSPAELSAFKAICDARSIDYSSLDESTAEKWEWVTAIGKHYRPNYQTKGNFVDGKDDDPT